MTRNEIMAKNLLDFKEVMDNNGIPFAIIFGLLLGIVRDNNFIEDDTDIDVACFRNTKFKYYLKMQKAKDDLIAKGFRTTLTEENCREDFLRDGEVIEVWWFQKIDKEWIFNNDIRYSEHFFDTLSDIDFLSTKFKVSHDPKLMLDATYEDWHTPLKKKDVRYVFNRTKIK